MEGFEPLARVDVIRHPELGTRLAMSHMDAEETTQVEATMARGERLWLALVLLRGLWRR